MRTAFTLAASFLASAALSQTILVEPDKIFRTGGTVKMLDGLATLIVQPNTFAENTQIPVSTNPLVPSAPELVLGSGASIGFPGLAFSKPVQLQMSFEGLSLPSGVNPSDLKIFRLWNHRWSALPSTVDTVDMFVQTTISLGGTYALLARSSGNPAPENAIIFRSTNHDVSSSWRRVAPIASPNPTGAAGGFEELSRDADVWSGSELAPTENGVYFIRRHAGGSDFYMAALNGDLPTRITNLAFSETTGASFNPTSTTMAFTALVGGSWRLYRMMSDGRPPAVVANLGFVPSSATSMSPTANQVAVGGVDGSIYVFDVASGSLVKTLATGGTTEVIRVAFSPNGGKVAFLARSPLAAQGLGEVGSVNTGSGAVQRATNSLARAIAWDPNSAKLAYGEREIYVWTVGSGTRTLVVSLQGQLQTLLWR